MKSYQLLPFSIQKRRLVFVGLTILIALGLVLMAGWSNTSAASAASGTRARLWVALDPSSPPPRDVIAGASNVTFTVVRLSTGNSDVVITAIGIVSDSKDAYRNVNSIQLFDGATLIGGPKDLVPTSVGSVALITDTFTIPANTDKVIRIVANVSSQANGSARLGVGSIQAKDELSGESIRVKGLPVYGSVMTFKLGQLSVSLDSGTPPNRLAIAGSRDVPVTVLRFQALNEDILLLQLGLQFDGTNLGALIKITVWDGATKVGEGVFAGTNRQATTTLASPVIIPKDGNKVLTIRADLSPIGINLPAQAGDQVGINYDGDRPSSTNGVGMVSGRVIQSDTREDSNAGYVRLFKSLPALSRIPIPSNDLVNGSLVLFRFAASASPAGDASFGKMTFSLVTTSNNGTTSPLSVTGFRLYAFQDSSFTVPAYASSQLNNGPLFHLETKPENDFYFNPVVPSSADPEAIAIPAAVTYYFELKGDASGVEAGDTVAVSLLGDASFSGVGTPDQVDSYLDNDLIWSGNSTTTHTGPGGFSGPDWSDGHLIPGLPSGGMIPQVLTR